MPKRILRGKWPCAAGAAPQTQTRPQVCAQIHPPRLVPLPTAFQATPKQGRTHSRRARRSHQQFAGPGPELGGQLLLQLVELLEARGAVDVAGRTGAGAQRRRGGVRGGAGRCARPPPVHVESVPAGAGAGAATVTGAITVVGTGAGAGAGTALRRSIRPAPCGPRSLRAMRPLCSVACLCRPRKTYMWNNLSSPSSLSWLTAFMVKLSRWRRSRGPSFMAAVVRVPLGAGRAVPRSKLSFIQRK